VISEVLSVTEIETFLAVGEVFYDAVVFSE